MKVLLLNPICYNSIDYLIKDIKKMKINADEPFGLMYISSYVKENIKDINIKIYDHHIEVLKYCYETKILNEDIIWNLLKNEIDNFNPEIIGVSGLYEYNADIFHKTIKKIKEINNKIIIVVGGMYPTTNDLSFDKNIDYIIIGEGEIKFCKLLNIINDYTNNNIEYISNLDSLPLPDRDNLPIGNYAVYGRQLTQRFYKDNCKTASILISRGCPNHCIYCSGYTITNRDYRYRSVKNIINEIKYLKNKYNIEVFLFQEENPCVNLKFTKELYKALIPLKIKWISQSGFYVNRMDKKFIKLAIKSGLLVFNLAFESGSKRMLKIVKKPESIVDCSKKVMKYIRKYKKNIYCNGFFMFGFAEENWNDINESIEFMKTLDLDWYQINMLQVFKGCELYEKYKNIDCIDIQKNDDSFYIKSKVKNINGIDRKELSDYIYEKVNLDLNFRNNRCFRIKNYNQVIRDMQHILNITNGKHEEAKKLLDKIDYNLYEIFKEDNLIGNNIS